MCQMAETRKVFLVGVGPGGREEAMALVASDLAIEVVWELHPRPLCRRRGQLRRIGIRPGYVNAIHKPIRWG